MCFLFHLFLQAEDGIRALVRSRGLGDVYKRQSQDLATSSGVLGHRVLGSDLETTSAVQYAHVASPCLLYTSDAADERSSVDLGGRRIIKKKNIEY